MTGLFDKARGMLRTGIVTGADKMRTLVATVLSLLICIVQAQAQQTKSAEACRAGCNKYCEDRMAKKTINTLSGCKAACEQQQCGASRTRF